MDEKEKNPEIHKEWQDNPKYWKLGIFYYNKADNRAIVPKRNSSMGDTLNFAKRGAIVVLLLMMAFFAFVVTMIETHKTANSQPSDNARLSRHR